ncbi:hypothetical protein CROQUDRAFT_98602 [Cronartium quercuum f. sp. fusiforme G11]|uniref:Tim10-like domain-containing protein n=1 Tax=Cronartium quercuum f. sp. fusiforme G11 TaxID=708437 RepID=A0A9P6ND94_9BASI|nr:hypothetical protein CROQUDRAFT_98602 [Cronartium quercuum f. sp. fusiforme G11]
MFSWSSSSTSDSGSSSSSPGLSPLNASNAKAEQLKQEVVQQLALANAQELINKINEKCYARCITSPSTTLSAREQARCALRILMTKMISNCMDRYLEAYNIVSRTYVDRITKERNQAALAASSTGGIPSVNEEHKNVGERGPIFCVVLIALEICEPVGLQAKCLTGSALKRSPTVMTKNVLCKIVLV